MTRNAMLMPCMTGRRLNRATGATVATVATVATAFAWEARR
jgi:chromate transport protein ChrA